MARTLEDLAVWRLGVEIREKVHGQLVETAASKDFKFRDQLRDAASSVTRNVAEGFGRYRHREFAQFLTISRGSLFEVVDTLQDGVARKYWSDADIRELLVLCYRAIAATTRLINYLRKHPDI